MTAHMSLQNGVCVADLHGLEGLGGRGNVLVHEVLEDMVFLSAGRLLNFMHNADQEINIVCINYAKCGLCNLVIVSSNLHICFQLQFQQSVSC
jgi:hypothetical protein